MNRETYRFLNSARSLHWQLLRLKAKHDELESCLLPAAIRYDKDKVQTSPDDNFSKIMAEIAELEQEMEDVRVRKSEQIGKIDRAVSALESEEERTALTMRFINRASVRDIAKEMGYSDHGIWTKVRREIEKI